MSEQGIIDISDMRNPVLSPLQKQVKEAASAHPVTITTEGILQAAREQTGLSNFGEEDFIERLDVWVDALNGDTGASDVIRASMLEMYIRYAATRLRLEDLIAKHPEILDVEIDRPIIVAGLPRSGTTHLLNLISADSRLRSLPWWEAIAPYPAPEDQVDKDGVDPRYTRAAEGWVQMDAVMPYIKAIHEFSPDHISEDIELQALDFSTYIIEWQFHAEKWRDYYFSQDQSGSYAYLKRALQALTWIKGPNRWVLKCPQHMEQLAALYKTFPDATFVINHRDPVASIQSAMTAGGYSARLSRKKVDDAEIDWIPTYWIDRYKRLLKNCVEQRDVLPAEQTIDVYFDKLMADTDSYIREIYRMADIPLTDDALAELHAYIDSHPRGRHGKMVYNLRRDFNLEPAEVRKEFDFYFEKFPVKTEVK